MFFEISVYIYKPCRQAGTYALPPLPCLQAERKKKEKQPLSFIHYPRRQPEKNEKKKKEIKGCWEREREL
jgi:hypothetical protein